MGFLEDIGAFDNTDYRPTARAGSTSRASASRYVATARAGAAIRPSYSYTQDDLEDLTNSIITPRRRTSGSGMASGSVGTVTPGYEPYKPEYTAKAETKTKDKNWLESALASVGKGSAQYAFNLNDWLGTQLQIVVEGFEPLKKLKGVNLFKAMTAASDTPIEQKVKATSAGLEAAAVPDPIKMAKLYANAEPDKNWVSKLRALNKLNQKSVVESLTKAQNMQAWGENAQNVFGALESTPYSVAAWVPYGVGFVMSYGASMKQNFDQKYQQAMEDGTLTDEEAATMLQYASGAALIDAGTEQIWKIGGAEGKLMELVGKTAGKSVGRFVLHAVAYLAAQGAQEGTEEIFSGLGQGFLAKMTTDPNATLFSVAEENGLISLEGLWKQFWGGALMGSVMSAFSRNAYKGFDNTKAVIEEKKDIPVNEVTDDDISEFEDAIRQDLEDPANVAEVNRQTAQAVITDGVVLDTLPDENVAGIITQTNKQREIAQRTQQQTTPQATAVAQAEPIPARNVQNVQNVQQKSVMQTLTEATPTFSKTTKQVKVGDFTVSYNANQQREAKINVDTNEITLGRLYFKEGVTAQDQAKYLTHEYAHSILKQNNITGADLVAGKLFGKLGTVNAEESAVQHLQELLQNPDFVAQHPNMSKDERVRFEYVQKLLNGTKSDIISGEVKYGTETETATQTRTIPGTEIGENAPGYNRGNGGGRVQQGTSGRASESLLVNEPSGQNFHSAISQSVVNNPYGAYVEVKSLDDYKSGDYKLFLSQSKGSGVAIKSDGDIVSVFKNPASGDINAMHSIMITALRNGGTKLDCYAGYLPHQYAKYGFVPVSKVKFNEEYAPSNWNYKRDNHPDIIFMKHNGDSVDTVLSKIGQYPIPNMANIPYAQDYDAGMAMRDAAMKSQTEQKSEVETEAQARADSTTGQAEFAKFDNSPEKLLDALQEKMQDAIKSYHEKRFFEVELELYRIFSEKLKNRPKGQDINRYIIHVMEAITADKPSDVVKKIEQSFKTSELYHAIYTDKAAFANAKQIAKDQNEEYAHKGIENFGIDHYARQLVNSLTPDSVPSKADLVILQQYIDRLYNMPEGTGNAEAARFAKKISKLMTKSGQFIQAASMLKKMFPEYHAEQIAKEYERELNKDVSPDVRKEADNVIILTADVIKTVRKKAGQSLRLNLTVQDLFANRIMRMLEPMDSKVQTEIEKRVRNLYEKFREVVPIQKTGIEKQNIYKVLAELVTNRKKYAQYWQQAREIIYQNETMNQGGGMTRENFETIQNYFTQITQVDFINRVVSQATMDTIKAMNTTVSELAQKFFLTGQESITEFADAVRTQVEKSGITMDEDSYNIMERYLKAYFKGVIAIRHKQDIERFVDKYSKLFTGKTATDDRQRVIDAIIKATYYDVFADTKSQISKVWADKLGIPVMTDAIRDMIYDYAKRYAMATDETAKDRIYEELTVKLADNIPVTLTEKIQTWLRTSMLFNPVTWGRNMISNVIVKPFYRQTDTLANYFMRRMKDMPTDEMIAGEKVKKYNANDAYGRIIEPLTTDDTIKRVQAKNAKYSLAQLFGMERRIFKTKWLQTMSEIPYEIMSTGQYKKFKFSPLGDIYMFKKWYQEGMYNKLIALGYNTSISAEEQSALIEQAKEYAATLATIRTFRQANILSSVIRAAQNECLKHGKTGKIAYTLLKGATPFVVTPAAITSEVYKFSPLALAKAVVLDYGVGKVTGKWDKHTSAYKANYAKRVSQALTGTAFQFAAGAILSVAGILTGDWPEDEDERKQWEAQGKRPYSIFIPGLGSISIDWAQPISTGLMIGAQTFQTLINADKSVIEKVASPFASTLDVLVNQTLLKNIFQLFGSGFNQDASATSKVSDFAQTILFQGMPAIIKKLNRIIDPYERNVYSGSAVQIFFNRVLQSVPAGTYFIPKKIDVWGREIKQTNLPEPVGAMARFVLNFIMPFTYSQDKMDSVTKEVTRVFNETKGTLGAKALPSIANKSISRTKDGVSTKWELYGQDYIDYQQAIGKASYDAVKALISSGSYSSMTDQQKAKKLAEIYSDAVRKAGDDYVSRHPQ